MRQDDREEKQERRDFFISYTGQDKPWAEWIAAQLDAAGYTFFFHAWDFRPGSNFVIEMDRATRQVDCTLLILSAAYLQSSFARSEWAAAFRRDPTGSERRLLPVRIEPCELDGLLAQIGYLDLVGFDAEQARECLLSGIQAGRVRPAHVPFPDQKRASVAFPGAFPAVWNIPVARNPFFIGREALLEQLHLHLQTMQATTLNQPQAISGLGGTGKTQLALEYSYRYHQEYQAVLWARADTNEALNASYTEIARLLQLPQQDAQEQEVIVQAVKDWLRSKGGWLLILDNADELDLVQPFLPTACPGHLLLTTRAQIMGKLARRLEVETLGSQEGALLLLRRAGLLAADASLETASLSDRALATALNDELGGLPLALDQAGAYIEETQCSLADYQQQYQTQGAELLAHRGMLVDDHPEPVATTWSLSFAKVEVANPIAANVLRLCAFLAPDALPEELLEEALKQFASSEERSLPGQRGSAPEHARSRSALDQAIALLRTYSLIQRNPAEKTVQVHRLVQIVLRATLNETEREDWMRFAILLVNALFPPGDFTTWAQ